MHVARHEAAFREEALLFLISIPLAAMIADRLFGVPGMGTGLEVKVLYGASW